MEAETIAWMIEQGLDVQSAYCRIGLHHKCHCLCNCACHKPLKGGRTKVEAEDRGRKRGNGPPWRTPSGF